MKGSIQRQLSLALFSLVLGAGVLAGSFAYYRAADAADDEQDERLRLIAQLAVQAPEAAEATIIPDDDDDDAQILIVPLSQGEALRDTHHAFILPRDIADGFSTIESARRTWRVFTVRSGANGVATAQRTVVREHVAALVARDTVLPLLVLIPALLVLTHLILRRAFAPLARIGSSLSLEADTLHRFTTVDAPLEVVPFLDQLNLAWGRMQRLLEERKRFIADAAHELRSPMTALIVQADNLTRIADSDAMRERLLPLREGLSRTAQLLNQLLSLSRLQAMDDAGRSIIAVRPIIHDVVESVLPLAAQKGIQIEATRLDDLSISGSSLALTSLFGNALDNAIRYSPRDAIVEIALFLEGDQLVLSVTDSGPGIPEAERSRVFQPFYRAAGDQPTAGTGLGLAIVAAAAARLGGRVTLLAQAPCGLRFEYRQRRTLLSDPVAGG